MSGGFKWLADDEARFQAMCSAAAEEMAAYRKALEPFLREWLAGFEGDSPDYLLMELVALDKEANAAMLEAAFRMGLLLPPRCPPDAPPLREK